MTGLAPGLTSAPLGAMVPGARGLVPVIHEFPCATKTCPRTQIDMALSHTLGNPGAWMAGSRPAAGPAMT